MRIDAAYPQLDSADFARRFSLRRGNLMWFLGAGASAAAGIPTAWDMVWEFKQLLFVSQRRVSPKLVADLSNPAIRAQLNAHIEASAQMPRAGSPEEYAALFEAVYPAETDRRAYLDSKVAGARPSYGHLALATLMRADFTRLIWTTNFDPLIADACAKVYDATGPLTTVALDAPELASQRIADGRWPVEIKLHGDFRSRRLKNTGDELRHQDVRLRQILVESCQRFGLVVAGYSGRDTSIMDALEQALIGAAPFPTGLFWLHHGEQRPLPRVIELLSKAAGLGVEASLVRVESFDEALRDLVRLIDLDTKWLDEFSTQRQRWSPAPIPSGRKGWPIIRLNALPLSQLPSVCRRVVCNIGGYAEVRKAVEHAKVNLLAARSRAGVLCYGSDSDVRIAFKSYEISDFDLHTIEPRRLRYESAERGLLRGALTCAVTRNRQLNVLRRRSSDLLTPSDTTHSQWAPLRGLVGPLNGVVFAHPELKWREGVGIRLDWANDRLWLLIEPRTVFDGVTVENKTAAADFARERTVRRYNQKLDELIAFWASFLGQEGREVRALGIGDGVDAVFQVSPEMGFSRRALP